VLPEDSSIESSSAARSLNMQRSFFAQTLSLSLAALMTLAVLVGIDHQAQPQAADQQLAQVVAPRA
jgi:negative regulator of sigma E activity